MAVYERAEADAAAGSSWWLGNSEMWARLVAFDWSQTPLGAIEDWSRSLRSAVSICLHSPFQMALYWGAGLTCIYNDAEREVLGNLHPHALGLPARELLRDLWDVVGPQLQAVMTQGRTTWAEDQPLRVDRRGELEVAYFTYAYSPILDDDGSVGGVLLVTHETTARVLAERRMGTLHQLTEMTRDAPTVQQACEQASRALTSGPDVPFVAIYLCDAHERQPSCVAASAGGRSVEPAVPRLTLEAAPNGSASGIVARAGAGGGVVEAAALIAPNDRNGNVPRRAFVAAIGADASRPSDGIAIVGLNDDLPFDDSYRSFVQIVVQGIARTVARARARELEQRQRDSIAALDQAKSALLSNVSHELRTPLALILGQLEQVLETDEVLPPGRESLTIAQRSAMRMLKLVGALLDFSRLEAGEHEGDFQPTDLPQLTRDVAAMFRSTAERAGLRLVLDCPPTAVRVYIDRDAWERILANLLSNAIKFTPAGEIRVSTTVEGEAVVLAIEDTGIGIAQQDLGRIFSRFYRAADARARSHEGAGIGLALVRELVALHGGTIEAESQPGAGTRMIVRVPARVAPLAPTSAPEGARQTGGASAAMAVAEAEGWLESAVEPPARNRRRYAQPSARVLIAEDNADMQQYLGRVLSPHFEVQFARDGAEAHALVLGDDAPSIVICDVMMPGMDGLSLLRALRADPQTAELPVLLISARADPENTTEALELGADDYLVKPFGAREILARVRAALENAARRSNAAASRGRILERVRRERELRVLLNDLRATQRRVAAAGDAERLRIERNLHDGAQQRLMACRLELGLARELLEDDPAAAAARLEELHGQLDAALEELRDLAHGLYPAALITDGLYGALCVAARRAPIPVSVSGAENIRAPRSIESAAYFCCLEALQNAAKHGGGHTQAWVELDARDGVLRFQVRDDGAGFDTVAIRPGHGLTNMRDRLEALAGRVSVSAELGRGTTVTGEIPLP